MTTPAPRNLRETFQLFRHFLPSEDLKEMLRDVDFTDVQPRQLYYAVQGRAPERAEFAIAAKNYVAVEKYIRGLHSAEFRANLIPRFLDAFAEKQRLLFIHIPKAAGSELSARMVARYPWLHSQWFQAGWTTDNQLFLAIRNAVVGLDRSDQIFVCGHNTLERYRAWRAIRFDDRIFTVVREPLRAILSQVNYVMTRIFIRSDQPQPDTLGWRRVFEVADVEQLPDRASLIELGRRILRHQGVVPPNVACRFLGGPTMEAALDRIICYAIEITDTEHLDQWFRDRWQLEQTTRSNESRQFIREDDLSTADRDYIQSATSEDAKLFSKVRDRMARLDSSSVLGSQLS